MNVFELLNKNFPDLTPERDFSFSAHTTIGAGGVAQAAISPVDAESAAACITYLERERIPHCFLGAGANVLPADGRYEGAVVRFRRMKRLYHGERYVYAGAGVTGGELLAFAQKNGFTGFEPFVGIPMTVGGACAMNAGIPERHFSDLVTRVVALRHGKIRTLNHRECRFSLKDSVFLQGIAVLGVYFSLERASQKEIAEKTKFFAERRKKLPKGRSMGCVFVNPMNVSAGALIDRCGLKGRRVGGAFVSSEHANFIINEGGSAGDVARLIEEVKNEVYEKTGILLREEVKRLP